MSLINERLADYLNAHGVEYQVIHHKADYTAPRAAEDTHTPGHCFAKVVVLEVDGAYALAVLPANQHIDMIKALTWFDASEVRLASEQEIFELFPDCEVGAQPPFGNLYGLAVFVSPELASNEFITFNGGTHEDAVRLRYEDFKRLAQPAVLDIVY